MNPRRQLAVLGLATAMLMPGLAARGQNEPVKTTVVNRTLRLPEVPYSYSSTANWPAHFKASARRTDNTPSNNKITDDGATLGRVLFYDKRMSVNNSTACASCHEQKKAFADPRRFSKGHGGLETDRHAPSLVNVRFYTRGKFFWDERAGTLEEQVLMPIQSKVEMGHDLAPLVNHLAEDPIYAVLFQKAFGDPKITTQRMSRALAQFVRSLVSCESKFDEGLAKVESIRESFPNFTAQENRGRQVFANQCARCHLPGGQTAGLFMNTPRNNGLDLSPKTGDGGVGDITFNRDQIGLFKSPSLRNVEVTGHYMHDGRFTTLEQVIEHYSTGVKNHPNADGRLRRRLNLSAQEKTSLVAFLKTLTDQKFLTDPKFSDPFTSEGTTP